MIKPDALIAAASMVNREWGTSGYLVERVIAVGYSAALLQVVAGDGARFFVAATEYGNTVHADTRDVCERLLVERIQGERG